MKKTIELTLEQARELLGKDAAMDVLIKANFTDDELNTKPKMGWYIEYDSEIRQCTINEDPYNRNVFPYKSQAEGCRAMSQLAKKMAEVNGEWRSYKSDGFWSIEFYSGKPTVIEFITVGRFLTFETRKIATKFLNDNRELIEEYGKIFLCE